MERCLKIALLVMFHFSARGNRRPCKERFCLPYRVDLSAGVERIIHAHTRACQMPVDVLREIAPQCKVRAKLEHRQTRLGKSKGEGET